MTRLRLAPKARDDIRDIRIYTKAAFGPVVARDYLTGLRAVFGLLREQPSAGQPEDFRSDLRGFVYRSHRIYYRIDAAGLLIVRILHHARDAPRAMDRDA